MCVTPKGDAWNSCECRWLIRICRVMRAVSLLHKRSFRSPKSRRRAVPCGRAATRTNCLYDGRGMLAPAVHRNGGGVGALLLRRRPVDLELRPGLRRVLLHAPLGPGMGALHVVGH